MIFKVIVKTKDDNNKSQNNELQYTLHKDKDGKFRVNYDGLIDYRVVEGKGISNSSNTIALKPVIVARIGIGETRIMQVKFDASPPYIPYGIPIDPGECTFTDGSVREAWYSSAQIAWSGSDDGRFILMFDSYKDYPTVCSIRIFDIKKVEIQYSK